MRQSPASKSIDFVLFDSRQNEVEIGSLDLGAAAFAIARDSDRAERGPAIRTALGAVFRARADEGPVLAVATHLAATAADDVATRIDRVVDALGENAHGQRIEERIAHYARERET